jgi:hypothetical protein
VREELAHVSDFLLVDAVPHARVEHLGEVTCLRTQPMVYSILSWVITGSCWSRPQNMRHDAVQFVVPEGGVSAGVDHKA